MYACYRADITRPVLQDIPKQRNGFDCGVFVCMYAEYVTRGAPLTFSQVRADTGVDTAWA